MSSETQYYCDICDKEIPHKDVRKIQIRFIHSQNYEELDICDNCFKEATKGLYSDVKEFENKRLRNILKLWFRRK